MRRTVPLSQRIYNHIYPNPQELDPRNFSSHLSRFLVPEVRIETARFYGGLETVEARYPGLNYTSKPHRKRLGRFPHHARLFIAFDELDLTESEILAFCRWEGTLWARQRYEKDEGVKVVDTTGMEIPSAEHEADCQPRRMIRVSSREVGAMNFGHSGGRLAGDSITGYQTREHSDEEADNKVKLELEEEIARMHTEAVPRNQISPSNGMLQGAVSGTTANQSWRQLASS